MNHKITTIGTHASFDVCAYCGVYMHSSDPPAVCHAFDVECSICMAPVGEPCTTVPNVKTIHGSYDGLHVGIYPTPKASRLKAIMERYPNYPSSKNPQSSKKP